MSRIGYTLALLAVASGVAFAQPAPQTAEEHYEQSKRYYAVDEFDKAIAELKTAYTMSPDPNYLFNIAQAMRKKGDCVGATDYYKKYLRDVPGAPNKAKVEGWINELEPCVKAKLAEPKPIDPKPVDPPPTDPKPKTTGMVDPRPPPIEPRDRPHGKSGLRIGGLVTGGVGGVLLVAGTVFAVSAHSTQKDVEIACNSDAGCNWETERKIDKRGQSRATQSKIMFGVGAAAVVGGAVMYVLGRPGREAPVALVPTTSGGLVVTSGRF